MTKFRPVCTERNRFVCVFPGCDCDEGRVALTWDADHRRTAPLHVGHACTLPGAGTGEVPLVSALFSNLSALERGAAAPIRCNNAMAVFDTDPIHPCQGK